MSRLHRKTLSLRKPSQKEPAWIGAGFGASRQTGWTGLVAKLIQLTGILDPVKYLEAGKRGAFAEPKKDQ